RGTEGETFGYLHRGEADDLHHREPEGQPRERLSEWGGIAPATAQVANGHRPHGRDDRDHGDLDGAQPVPMPARYQDLAAETGLGEGQDVREPVAEDDPGRRHPGERHPAKRSTLLHRSPRTSPTRDSDRTSFPHAGRGRQWPADLHPSK